MKYSFVGVLFLAAACSQSPKEESSQQPVASSAEATGQEAVQDDDSQKDVVKVAVGSPDHTTLVTALKQADLVTALANAGPFTVFAPVNAAFDKLPSGTVESLLKPENIDKLKNVLEYHVTTSALSEALLTDGMKLGMVNGSQVAISKKDGKTILNGKAEIIGSVHASNGMVYIINEVLVPEK